VPQKLISFGGVWLSAPKGTLQAAVYGTPFDWLRVGFEGVP